MKVKKLSVKFKLSLKSAELILLVDYEKKVVLFSIAPHELTSEDWSDVFDFLRGKNVYNFEYSSLNE